MFYGILVSVLSWWIKVWSKTFWVFQHLTGKSSWAYTWFLWAIVVVSNLAYDMKVFDPTDWFLNIINLIGYIVIVWMQIEYDIAIRKNKMSNSSDDVLSVRLLWTSWFGWHVAIIIWYSLFIGFAFSSPFFFFRLLIEILWHVGCILYVSGGKKTIWSKIGEKAKSMLESRTPNWAPLPT